MELNLSDLFVLAACGKLPALEFGDDLGGDHALGALNNEAQRAHGAVKDSPAFVEGKNALVEEGLEKGRRNGAAR
jgi:hypothetical protein